MIGCLIANQLKTPKKMSKGAIIALAVTDVILSKLVFEDLRSDEQSDQLYASRFDYFLTHAKIDSKETNLSSWGLVAMIPIGFSSETVDDAIEEAKRCIRMMSTKPALQKEAQILASLIFLGKEGVPKESIDYFLQAEFQTSIKKLNPTMQQLIKELLTYETFEHYLNVSLKRRHSAHALVAGGLGQAFYPNVSESWLDLTLDTLPEDYKRIVLSFMKTFSCFPKIA